MRGQTGGQDDWITFLDDGKGIYLGLFRLLYFMLLKITFWNLHIFDYFSHPYLQR